MRERAPEKHAIRGLKARPARPAFRWCWSAWERLHDDARSPIMLRNIWSRLVIAHDVCWRRIFSKNLGVCFRFMLPSRTC